MFQVGHCRGHSDLVRGSWRQLTPHPLWNPAPTERQACQGVKVNSAKLFCLNFLPGEGNLSLAGQGVPENHVGHGLDCGEDQRGRSPSSTARKREAPKHVPGQPGRTEVDAGPVEAMEDLGKLSLGFQRPGPPTMSSGGLSGCIFGR